MNAFTEQVVEQAALDWFQVLRRRDRERPRSRDAAGLGRLRRRLSADPPPGISRTGRVMAGFAESGGQRATFATASAAHLFRRVPRGENPPGREGRARSLPGG